MPSPPPEPAPAVPAGDVSRVAAESPCSIPSPAQLAALPGRLPEGLGARLAFANSPLDPAAAESLSRRGLTVLTDTARPGPISASPRR